jgi:hypothetical protein
MYQFRWNIEVCWNDYIYIKQTSYIDIPKWKI